MSRSKLDFFFNPRSVAIVGASAIEGKVGRVILENFIAKFKGKVYPVNPKYESILGLKCYGKLSELPEIPELAVIAIPAPLVPGVVREAGELGVKGAIVISGGFSEVGEEGRRLEEELAKAIRDTGIRVIGPNCIGVYDAHSGVDTFFLPEERLRRPPKGRISIISQSGAFVGAILDWASKEGIGICKAISYGNKIDVDDVELLEYLAEDPLTKVILIYIEGLKPSRGRAFIEAARRASSRKPVLVLKGGKTSTGARAAASHTAALAGSYEVYKAAFKQAGLIEAESFEDMFDMARALAAFSPAEGPRVLVLTDAGGMGVMAVDALEKLGLKVPELSSALKARLREVLPPHCIVENPVDLTGDTDDERYRTCLEIVLRSSEVDSVLLIALMQVPKLTEHMVDVVREAIDTYGKPIVVCMVGGEFTEAIVKKMESQGIPVYRSPERAAKALWALYYYGSRRM